MNNSTQPIKLEDTGVILTSTQNFHESESISVKYINPTIFRTKPYLVTMFHKAWKKFTLLRIFQVISGGKCSKLGCSIKKVEKFFIVTQKQTSLKLFFSKTGTLEIQKENYISCSELKQSIKIQAIVFLKTIIFITFYNSWSNLGE